MRPRVNHSATPATHAADVTSSAISPTSGAAAGHHGEGPAVGEIGLRAALEELAARVQRLTIDRRDPERFHEERSEIAHALRCLARSCF